MENPSLHLLSVYVLAIGFVLSMNPSMVLSLFLFSVKVLSSPVLKNPFVLSTDLFFANGVRNDMYNSYVMNDGDKILLSYGSEGQEEIDVQLNTVETLSIKE